MLPLVSGTIITNNFIPEMANTWLMLHQTRENLYQTVRFDVYIHNLLFVFKCSTKSLTISTLKQLILDKTRQNGYQTVPFSVYII